MAEYIKKDEIIKLIQEDKVEITPKLLTIATFAAPNGYSAEVCYKALNDTCDRHIKEIRNLPVADVQPVVHAKWIETTEDAEYDYGYRHIRKLKCSCCGYCQSKSNIADSGALLKSRYCPVCGAKMDGKN